jgi:transposase
MKTYSLDLRQRLVDAVDDGIDTYGEIAEEFGVHESYIYKLLRQRRDLGHIVPLPHGGGAQLKLDDKALNTLTELVKQEPDMTLDELRLQLRKKTKINVSVSTIWYGLEKRDLSVKKRRG